MIDNTDYHLSTQVKRNKIYNDFIAACHSDKKTVDDIIRLGSQLMRKARLHHHFFQNSLQANAEYLTQYYLKNIPTHEGILTPQQAQGIFALFERRIAERIPVEYITQEAEYLNHRFYVNEHVLVPRSLMNTRFQDFLSTVHWENHRVLDLCTGSGCIGISLALMEPNIQVDLADISEQALAVAQTNVDRYALNSKVRCIHSDLFTNLKESYDLIITNPPYVSTREYTKSPAEFQNEPKLALESGKDGLDIIRRILGQAKNYLNPNGILIAEVGFTSAARIKKQYPHIRFKWFKYRRPNGKESFFGMHGIFLCERSDLD